MDLLDQATSNGCLSADDTSQLDSLVATTSAFESSYGGNVAGWGVQPVFHLIGGQFAGSLVTGPVGWVPLVPWVG
jgi:hypothetical protein